MKRTELSAAELHAVVADARGGRVVLTQDGLEVAAVVSIAELTTLDLQAGAGVREAIAEGRADLAAGRAQDWLELRGDYGRVAAEPAQYDDDVPATAGPVGGARGRAGSGAGLRLAPPPPADLTDDGTPDGEVEV